MAAPTCLYTDPKKAGDGPRLYLSNLRGWVEDPDQALEFFSLSTAPRVHQVPIGYQPSQVILAEAIKTHPAVRTVQRIVPKLRELFPDATVTSIPPTNIQRPWFIDVAMPPHKRSLMIEYRYQRHHYHIEVFGKAVKTSSETFINSDEEMLLRAIDLVEPLTCHCDCHEEAGIFHCFGGPCCDAADVARTNAHREARGY